MGKNFKQWAVGFTLGISALLIHTGAISAAPPANSIIGNQATANYNDTGGTAQTVSSNLVQTTIQQVYSHTLTASQSKVAFPGGTVYYPHTLTNTGNGTDTYALGAVDANTGTITFTSLNIYADANGDGIPDNATPITSTGSLAAAGVFRFVVAAQIPAAAANGALETVTVNSTGNVADTSNSPVAAGTNTDTVTVQTGPVMQVTKNYSITSGPRPNTVTATLTFTNIGGATATNFRLVDIIGATGTVGATSYDTRDMTYGGSLNWNGSAVTCLTPPVGFTCTTQPTAGTAGTLDVTVASVAPGQSGQITFVLNVIGATVPGAERTRNVAAYRDSVNTTDQATNAVTYLIAATASVRLADSGPAGAAPVSTTDGDGNTNNDVIYIASAAQGATVQFQNILTNTGTATDSFDMTVFSNTFPVGTTFQFYNTNNTAPLTDSNGNGLPDTGPVAAGASVSVWVRASLPGNATVDAPGWDAVIRATSKNDAAQFDNTTDRLNDVIERTVDLRNVVGGVDAAVGINLTGTGLPSQTQVVNPGSLVTFILKVANTSTVSDNYDLIVRAANTSIGASTVTTTTLPVGWSISFKVDGGAGTCATTGATITNTGSIAPAANLIVCAQVQTTAATGPADYDLFFRAASPSSANYSDVTGPDAGYDTKVDRITINAVSNLSLTPNRSGQVFPGGTVTYGHQLCNNGNTTVTSIQFPAVLANNDSQAGWSHSVYVDVNNDGVQDAGDTYVAPSTVIAGLTLAPGACAPILDKVFAPGAGTNGQVNTSSLQARGVTSVTVDSSIAQDVSTIITGNIQLVKSQRTVNCTTGAGVAPQATFTTGSPPSAVAPGVCLNYRVVASNIGSGSSTAVVINDAVPTYTTFHTTGCVATGTQSGAQAVVNSFPAAAAAAGTLVSSSTTQLDPGQSLTVQFCVRIDQ